MKGQKILAFVCSMILASNQISFSAIMVNAVGEDSTTNTEQNEASDTKNGNEATSREARLTEIEWLDTYQNYITVESKEYNGTTEAIVNFDNVILEGVAEGDDVALTGDAVFQDANAGEEKTVIVSNLVLTGNDAEKYSLLNAPEQLALTGTITPVVLYITPNPADGIIKGEETPKELGFSWTEDKVVAGDNVTVDAKVYIDYKEGSYIYTLDENSTTDNTNYILDLVDGLTVPDSSPNAPEVIQDAILSKENSDQTLAYYNFGIVSNGSVKLSVSAKSKQQLPVTFTLYNGQNEIGSVIIEKEAGTKVEGEECFLYRSEFTLTNDDWTKPCTYSSLTCIASNGTDSSNTTLQFKIENTDTANLTLILEQVKPYVSEDMLAIVNSNHGNRSTTIQGNLVDLDSGIKEIQYMWDDDNNWKSYTNFDANQKNDYVWFTVTRNDNGHKIKFQIIDHAGNTFTMDEADNYWTNDTKCDNEAPGLVSAKLEPIDETPLATVLRILSFGNYSNKTLRLTIKAKDNSNTDYFSGIKYIGLLDGSDSEAQEIKPYIFEIDEEGNEIISYTFELAPNLSIENWNIRVMDFYDNPYTISVSEALKTFALKEAETSETTLNTDESTESTETTTTEPSVDWEDLVSNKWIFDDQSPSIVDDYANKPPVNGIHYYGEEGGNFTLTITDEGGLNVDETVITQNYKLTLEETGKDSIIDIAACNQIENGYEYVVDTSKLDTGFYTFSVSAQDYACNAPALGSYQFYVDHEKPEGNIEVNFPSITEIDETDWIAETDATGKYQDVTFRLYADSNGAPLYGGIVTVNDEEYSIVQNDFNAVESDDEADEHYGMYYVDICINTGELKCSDMHTYEVKAEFWTESENKNSADYTLHVDTSNPTINSFTVDTKNGAADNILNVLTFGVFAKNALVLSVDVSDEEYDSGIDSEMVMISYIDPDGNTVSKEMDSTANPNAFSCLLDYDTQIFQSEITVTVFDKFGKSCTDKPNIKNTKNNEEISKNFVMMETVLPEVTFVLPETDSITRTDGEIWYRKHENSETDTEKLFVLHVKDVNSGIRSVKMIINGVEVTPEIEINHTALPTVETTSNANAALNSEDGYSYSYSLEKIAEMIPANEDGSYIIEIEVVDNAGNVNTQPVDSEGTEYLDAKPIYYRDIVKPSVVQFTFDPATSDDISEVSEFIEQLEYGFYFKKGFDAVVSVTDEVPSSGLDRVVFRLVPYVDGAEQEAELHEVKILDGKAAYTIPAGFKGQIYAYAYDMVGNLSDVKTPQGFVIDDVAPVITIEPLPDNSGKTDENGNKLYTGTVQFRVTISDPKSGLKEISYSKASEQDSYDAVVNTISNTDGYSENMLLANGWEITKTDVNLITEVSQVFTFNSDDNNIVMTFNATDRAANSCEPLNSEAFSIDTIAPEVVISNSAELVNNMYYPGSTTFTITVTERNFDPGLMVATITNGFTGTIPSVSFQSNGSVHTATVTFSEGDFEFSFSGEDRAGHSANISYNGGEVSNYFFEMFNVDATSPVIKTNFGSFGDDADEEIYFNSEQIAVIEVIEHNFDASDMGIIVEVKDAGTGHSADDENWSPIGYSTDWKHDGDTHTLEIPFATDGVYKIRLAPIDRAGNKGVMEEGSVDHTPVYEIDTTAPVFYARNDKLSTEKGFVTSPYFAVYDEKLKDAASPTVEFTDLNFDKIEIEAQVYTPTYENGMELGAIVMSPLAKELTKSIQSSKFTLNDFDKDGVYAFTFVAVDKAGNRSEVISDTYFRMVETDVLAYIYNTKKPTAAGSKDGTGYYSLVNEDGRAISKKAADFQNLDILVIKPTTDNLAGTLVLREDENQYSPQEYLAIENKEISETATMSYIQLPGNYFSETFRDDSLDTRMYLSVSIREDVYLDLAAIHIDNEAPTATLPEEFKDWHNYFFKDEVTISLTDISETLDKNATKVYECPRDGERTEIPCTYDSETDTLSFTLSKGQHHIDITLVDEAGNEWNIDRVRYLQVGNFRLYIGGAVLIVIAAGIGFFVWWKKKR